MCLQPQLLGQQGALRKGIIGMLLAPASERSVVVHTSAGRLSGEVIPQCINARDDSTADRGCDGH
jgi:hypothetical protein